MKDPDSRVIREFNDRGLIWLLESKSNLRDLVRILSEGIAESLDFERAERTSRSFIPDDLYKHEADMIFRVPYLHGEGEVIIYLLIEHQTAPDRTMGLRFLSYMIALWQAQERDWKDLPSPRPTFMLNQIIPILLYTGEEAWNTPIGLDNLMDIPAGLEDFVPKYPILSLRLRDVSTEELTRTGTALSWILNTLKYSKAPFAVISQKLGQAANELEKLPEDQKVEWFRAIHFLYLLIRHKRVKSERTPLYEQVSGAIPIHLRKEITDMILTDAEELVLEGKELGRQEGKLEGKLEGWRELILSHLRFKFGPLPEEVEAKIINLNNDNLQLLANKILSATSLSDMGL